MSFAPDGEAEKLLRIAGEETEELEGHFGVNISVGLIVRVEEDYGRTIALGEDVVGDGVVFGEAGACAVGAGDAPDAGVVDSADEVLGDDDLFAGVDEDAGTSTAGSPFRS